MKILRISGQGIASLYDRFDVDLESGALAEGGLFAVIGRTGAGKSTILDVMCLALYHRAARYQGNRDKKTLDQNDMFNNIMSRGADLCAAELEYLGQNGQRYRAVWSLRRVRTRNGEPKFVAEGCALETWNDSLGWERLPHTGVNDLLAQKEASIGLDYSQFTRVVLLPQGQFTSFLTADPKERTSILNGIADTEIYRRISADIYAGFKDLKLKLENLDQQKQSFMVLSEEELEQKRQENIQAEKTWKNLLQTQQRVQKYAESLALMHTAKEDCSCLAKSCEDEKKSFAPDLERLNIFEAHAGARDNCLALKHAQGQVLGIKVRNEELTQKIVSLSGEVKNANDALAKATEAKNEAEAQKVRLEPEIIAARNLETANIEKAKSAEQARVEADKIGERLKAAALRRQTAEKAFKAHQDRELALKERLKALENFAPLAGTVGQLEQAPMDFKNRIARFTQSSQIAEEAGMQAQSCLKSVIQAESIIAVAREEGAKLEGTASKLPEINAQVTEALDCNASLDAFYNKLLGAQKDLDNLALALEDANRINIRLEECRQQYKEVKNAVKEREHEVARCQREYGICQENTALKRSIMSLGEQRALLKDGCECPLCGSKRHPYIEQGECDISENAITQALALEQEVKKNLDAAIANHASKVAELKSLEVHGKQQVCDFKTAVKRENQCLETLRAQGSELLRFRDLDSELEEIVANSLIGSTIFDSSVPASSDFGDGREAKSQACAALREKLCALTQRVAQRGQAQGNIIAQIRKEQAEAEQASVKLKAVAAKKQKAEDVRNEALKQQNTLEAKGQSERAVADEAIGQAQSIINQTVKILSVMEPKPAWAHDGIAPLEADGFWQEVALVVQGLKELNDLGQRLALEADECRKAQNDLTEVKTQENELEGSSNAALEKLKTAEEELAGSQEARKKLLGGRSTAEVTGELERLCQSAREREEAARKGLSIKEAQLNGFKGELLGVHKQLTEGEEQLKASLKRWENDVAASGLPEATLEGILLIDDTVLHKLRQTREHLEKTKQDLGIKQHLLNARLEECMAMSKTIGAEFLSESSETSPEVEAQMPAELRIEATEGLEARVQNEKARMSALEGELAVDVSNRKKLQKLCAEELELQPKIELYRRLNDLIGSADGSKFCNIAQGITMYALTERANTYLKVLRPRYSMSIADKGRDGLVLTVVDHNCADAERSVLSLSGGEKFLVSLSLALGLSDMTCGGMIVESLFIDEGFDCVDTESLGVVLEALENLQHGTRTLGIISHVDMLARAVPVRLKVTSVSNGRSRIDIEENYGQF